jgi:hypothetical protein
LHAACLVAGLRFLQLQLRLSCLLLTCAQDITLSTNWQRLSLNHLGDEVMKVFRV